MLALLYSQAGQSEKARFQLHEMLADIDASPLAIARKQGKWRRSGRQLLRKLRTAQ
jgi:hypothetical protein